MRLLGLTVLAVLVLWAPAEAKVTCGAGTTAFVDGKLRIFGVHYRTPDEEGFEEYACLGRRMKPLYVGGVGSDTGVGSADTPVYAHAGRFLADYSQSDGEGGPSADVTVVDLVRRRTVSFMNVACCERTPAIRLAPDGTVAVLAPGEGVVVKAPGLRARSLTGEGVGRDLAMHGGTVYWREGSQARAATIAGVPGGEARALEPVRLRHRGGPCPGARGRTVAATGSVRVVERAGAARRFGCRAGSTQRFAAGPVGAPAPVIVADRWLLLRDGDVAKVLDSRTGEAVTSAQGVADATLLADGTLAWTDAAGAVHARSPGADAVDLATGGASALAAARRAVYWTEAGAPHIYRPPSSAARSASKPG